MKFLKNLATFGAGFGTGYAVSKRKDICEFLKNTNAVQKGATKLNDFSSKIIKK